MKFVLLYFIAGFLGHFLLLFIEEGEMSTFKQAPLKDKMTYLILNMSLGIFTLLFAFFNLGLEIYYIEKETYLQSKNNSNNEKTSTIDVYDDYDFHPDHSKYL